MGIPGAGGAGAGADFGFAPTHNAGMQDQMMEEAYGDEGDDDSADLGGNPFEQFASNPGFQQLRQRILQSPQFYQEFMQMLQTQQPQLYEAIQQNPQAFMHMLLGGGMGGGMGGGAGAGAGMGAGAGAGAGNRAAG